MGKIKYYYDTYKIKTILKISVPTLSSAVKMKYFTDQPHIILHLFKTLIDTQAVLRTYIMYLNESKNDPH